MFLDSHCHLVDKAFDDDRETMIARALDAGLRYLLTIACNDTEAPACIELAEQWDHIYVATGLHPHEASEYTEESLRCYRDFYAHPKLLGVGEIGLDFYYDNSPREQQETVFRRFLRLAAEFDKPVIIHLRDPKVGPTEATERFLAILNEEDPNKHIRGIMHCYSGGYDFAAEMHTRGFLVSFPGILTFKKADELRDAAARLPLEALLVETDCPYLAPVPKRGKRNEPAYVIETARMLAEIRGMNEADLDAALTSNFERLFGLV